MKNIEINKLGLSWAELKLKLNLCIKLININNIGYFDGQ